MLTSIRASLYKRSFVPGTIWSSDTS